MNYSQKIELLVDSLYNIGALKFGEYILKSGLKSPVYCDLRLIVSYPKLMKLTSELIVELIEAKNISYDVICGVPFGAIPIATAVSISADKPMILKRKEVKSYGTKKVVEGIYKQNDCCLVIEDVTTSGSSIIETFESLKEHQIAVKDSVVILDRQQGAKENLSKANIQMHSLLNLTEALEILLVKQKITNEIYETAKQFISNYIVEK